MEVLRSWSLPYYIDEKILKGNWETHGSTGNWEMYPFFGKQIWIVYGLNDNS